MNKSQAYRSFLLTAWQEQAQSGKGESVWHFGMEDVRGRSQRRIFATLEEVMEYIDETLEKTSEQQINQNHD